MTKKEYSEPEWAPDAPAPPVGSPGWLAFFDLIVIHTSGGKDSQTVLRHGLRAIAAAGVLSKTAVLHLWLDRRNTTADDAARIEWQQVPELAAEQAARAGVPLSAGGGWAIWDARAAHLRAVSTGAEAVGVTREAWAGLMHFARRDFDGDLLDDIKTRMKRDGVTPRGWPTMWTRFCTSDWKTAVGRAFTEYLCKQIRVEKGLTRPVRVLQIMGFRAEESDDRAARSSYALNYGVSAKMSRHVWEWLPIHGMTKVEVWDDIRESGVPYHPVYAEGMSRLSCRLCIMGSRKDLAISKRLSPRGAAAYEQVEADLTDSFQYNRPLAGIDAEPGEQGFDVRWTSCPTCAVPVLVRDNATAEHCPAHAANGPWNRAAIPVKTGGCGDMDFLSIFMDAAL